MSQLVSVIIPAFNAEHSIGNCIDSVINQDYPVEIMIIDDSSWDNTHLICSEYMDRYANIQIHKIEHAGVSAARNVGLKYIKGEYVLFCDADDVLLPNAISIMTSIYNESFDLIIGNVIKSNSPNITEDRLISSKEALQLFFRHDKKRILGTVYGKLFKTELLNNSEIGKLTFDENIRIGEDALFLLQYILRCQKVYLTHNYLYKHNYNASGIIASKNIDFYLTAIDACEYMIKEVRYEKDLYNLAIKDLFWVLQHIMKQISCTDDYIKVIDKFTRVWNSLLK